MAFLSLSLLCVSFGALADRQAQPKNIIFILADDLGYGDVGAFGNDLIRTPNIDELANEGISLTGFYTSGNVCTPSRAGIMTGQYPIRTGLADRTINIGDERGLKPQSVSLPEKLSQLGYKTALIGKWHLGDKEAYHPENHGFDEFYGLLYSNDEPNQQMLNGREKEGAFSAETLTLDFTEKSLTFIRDNRDTPFFLFLSYTAPHKPLIPSKNFAGKSKAGAYGDVVEELDWAVGQLMKELHAQGLGDDTLIIFTSDNGPFPEGSTGGLLGGKGSAWEGGYRVPFIARWPEVIEAGSSSPAMTMNIDIMPTLVTLAGGTEEDIPEVDGKDIFPVLSQGKPSPHDVLYFFNNERIAALRTPRWRLMLSDYPPWRDAQPIRFEGKKNLSTLLHDMNVVPSQQYDLSRDFPNEKRHLLELLKQGRNTLESLSKQPDSTQFDNSHHN
ncbi:sulfatase-like hydrolase/transferase [Pseudoteredinibacter isoporae]|uniref:sulfatase-like hydrolase/transferase n=1 Tax=Pseudoteredinibacter isoporae TaxID=570281 RepID=UPI003109BAA5